MAEKKGRRGPAQTRDRAPGAVFINFPFDPSYERLFVALVAGIVGVGAVPHCVLEVREHDKYRLRKIWELIASCPISIHELSCVEPGGPPHHAPRFNMPFELGLACAVSFQRPHEFVVFEKVPWRFQSSLSDLNAYDAKIHKGTVEGILLAILNCMKRRGKRLTVVDLLPLAERLQAFAELLKEKNKADDIFSTALFEDLVLAAIDIGEELKLFPKSLPVH